MKSSDIALLVGGLGVLYLIVQSRGASAAASSIAQTNLTANTAVSNANLAANAAQSVAGDIANIAANW